MRRDACVRRRLWHHVSVRCRQQRMGNSTSAATVAAAPNPPGPVKEVLEVLQGVTADDGIEYLERLPRLMDDASLRSDSDYTAYAAVMGPADVDTLAKAGYNAASYQNATVILFVDAVQRGKVSLAAWKDVGTIQFSRVADILKGTPISLHGTFGSHMFFLRTQMDLNTIVRQLQAKDDVVPAAAGGTTATVAVARRKRFDRLDSETDTVPGADGPLSV